MPSRKRTGKSTKRTRKQKHARKFIFVAGGVISGVGKGVTVSSIAKILQARGLKVTAIKIDPYINVDAGTMNPTEHGEVFVLADGDECDQDMGNYERFLNTQLTKDNYMTTGRVYQTVIARERNLQYRGKCVQVVPHIPLEVVRRITRAAKHEDADVTVIEIGGTVGEYENILYLEAARMLKADYPDDVAIAMVSYLPTPPKVGEMKTKPTQHATRQMNSAGVAPDVIIARSERRMDTKRREKIAEFCNVSGEYIISAPDVDSIYDVPINFNRQELDKILLNRLSLSARKSNLTKWKQFVRKTHAAQTPVKIGIVGKYFSAGEFVLSDAYISVIESIKYSAYHAGRKPEIQWLNARDFEGARGKRQLKKLSKLDGILVPGGFGSRGVEGKLNVIRYAREHNIPYFGLCYGMQLMVVEYAQHVANIKGAHTVEVDKRARHPIIDIMPEQKEKIAKEDYGGTMRLGHYKAKLKDDTIARRAYDQRSVKERHRHRYEVNPEYVSQLEKAGLVFSGTSPDKTLMEIAELPEEDHPFFLGTQFHPEFQAHPLHPHPLFTAFIKAASAKPKSRHTKAPARGKKKKA